MSELRQFLRCLPVFAGDMPDFDTSVAPERPEDLFVEWLTEAVAARVREPHAMTLSTLGVDDIPDARVLLLKNVDADGWQFASHRGSPKGLELEALSAAALTFLWREQGRQIRVRGRVVTAPPEECAADFLARSPVGRAEALAGRQSQPLHDRRQLVIAAEEAAERFAVEPDLVVDEWTLYTVRAQQVEFWQADKDRRHIRLQYLRDGETWQRHELWP
ncbi:pyridoxine/pyridoxamine 5'-phosphate oxidase [Actinoplanes couchii]|uniref:Pyridoxamine 5'-phosphate oxidase n=1 Tax=Actinoplanes couchii TaxID=403638 RepID=A0ABQ3XGP0_9ACTN|nr:pyridoxal 5'-phosphate synthase [Actinoplanes couchii]MDR6320843.1 pyridoxamine 5'-phosphate oxidase [Actinoplanes couchii]GID57673.1 pyridoxamine 5'-phosphate oxidase [Actinoplanes couchii]